MRKLPASRLSDTYARVKVHRPVLASVIADGVVDDSGADEIFLPPGLYNSLSEEDKSYIRDSFHRSIGNDLPLFITSLSSDYPEPPDPVLVTKLEIERAVDGAWVWDGEDYPTLFTSLLYRYEEDRGRHLAPGLRLHWLIDIYAEGIDAAIDATIQASGIDKDVLIDCLAEASFPFDNATGDSVMDTLIEGSHIHFSQWLADARDDLGEEEFYEVLEVDGVATRRDVQRWLGGASPSRVRRELVKASIRGEEFAINDDSPFHLWFGFEIEKQGLSRRDVLRLLKSLGVKVSARSISKWLAGGGISSANEKAVREAMGYGPTITALSELQDSVVSWSKKVRGDSAEMTENAEESTEGDIIIRHPDGSIFMRGTITWEVVNPIERSVSQ